ncbi:MAG: hypothetical protein Q7J54_00190 [Candidatus Woesearchaeota archaeon]|nr:hypothetical protein [Candidatus Woesearchaeota archaeon]
MTSYIEEFLEEVIKMSDEELIEKLILRVAEEFTPSATKMELVECIRAEIILLKTEILRRLSRATTNKTGLPSPENVQKELLSCGINQEFLKG